MIVVYNPTSIPHIAPVSLLVVVSPLRSPFQSLRLLDPRSEDDFSSQSGGAIPIDVPVVF